MYALILKYQHFYILTGGFFTLNLYLVIYSWFSAVYNQGGMEEYFWDQFELKV